MTEHKPLTAEEITETAVGQWTYRVDGPHREEINTFVHRLAEDLRAARAAREAAERERDAYALICDEFGIERSKQALVDKIARIMHTRAEAAVARDRLAAECESLRAVVDASKDIDLILRNFYHGRVLYTGSEVVAAGLKYQNALKAAEAARLAGKGGSENV